MQFLPVWTLITRFLWSCIIESFFYIEKSFPQMQSKSIQGKERLLMVLCINYKTTLSKGQLISKGLFAIFNSFKKQAKKIRLYYHDTYLRLNSFLSFFGRIEDSKRHFDIIWPLCMYTTKNWKLGAVYQVCSRGLPKVDF